MVENDIFKKLADFPSIFQNKYLMFICKVLAKQVVIP
jgi:hypothetical protein